MNLRLAASGPWEIRWIDLGPVEREPVAAAQEERPVGGAAAAGLADVEFRNSHRRFEKDVVDAAMPVRTADGLAVADEDQGFGQVHRIQGSVVGRGDDARDDAVGLGGFCEDDPERLQRVSGADDRGVVVGEVGDLCRDAVRVFDRAKLLAFGGA
ncbi:MAG: hypothetical protein IPM41_15825 [Sphingomonadales bacterium]|nr:hypothetical protein [Sphingomonadales bacterium]